MELLIAAFMASLVVSGLLFMITELLRIDNREIALEEVQRDTQRAMDFIADELQEAVYVYTTTEDTGNADPADDVHVTNDVTGVGAAVPGTPILAFWKVNPITQNEMPTGACEDTFENNPEKIRACGALKIRRASYDLVVYSQIDAESDSAYSPWEGRSRISRYVLSQYSDPISDLDENPGYTNPGTSTGEIRDSFKNWQIEPLAAGENLPGTASVLVDYIGLPGSSTASTDNVCTDSIPGSVDGDYVLSPPSATVDSSFFACVRDPGSVTTATQEGVTTSRSNQDIYIFLRGDASGGSSASGAASEDSRLPLLRTQVLVRGLINKEIND